MANRKKPLVVLTRKLPERVETRMRELFDARLNIDDRPMTAAELAEIVKSADVLVPTVTDRIDSSVLSKARAGRRGALAIFPTRLIFFGAERAAARAPLCSQINSPLFGGGQ